MLFGMLTQITDGKLYLEDDDAYIELDVSQSVMNQTKNSLLRN